MQLPSPDELKQKRIDLGLTQSDLAKRAGVSQPLIARIESGDVDPRLSTLKKIIEVFNDIEKEDICLKDIMNRDLISVSPEESIDRAVHIMKEYNISQIPVIHDGISVGSISEEMIVRSMAHKKSSVVSNMKTGDIMGDSFPTLSPGTDVKTASYMLEKHPAVLVLEKGHVAGVVTKYDILKLLNG